MNEFDMEVREKAQIAKSSHFKGNKGGCRLPTDNLTNRQIEQKHGEVYSMNLNKPMYWADFKQLPLKMRVEYYNHLVERFTV